MGHEPIVVVNGGFDNLHEGHIDLFRDASNYGKVYAFVNGNEVLIKKKGFYFMDEKVRAKIVGALRSVTLSIIIEDEPHWEKTMRALRPKYIYFDGDKKSINNLDTMIPEVCNDIGCEIVFGQNEKVNSSSKLLRNYRNMHLYQYPDGL